MVRKTHARRCRPRALFAASPAQTVANTAKISKPIALHPSATRGPPNPANDDTARPAPLARHRPTSATAHAALHGLGVTADKKPPVLGNDGCPEVREPHEISNCERLEAANAASPVKRLLDSRRLPFARGGQRAASCHPGEVSVFTRPSRGVATAARHGPAQSVPLLGAANVKARPASATRFTSFNDTACSVNSRATMGPWRRM